MEFVLSLYNFHRKEAFKGDNSLYTGGLSLETFLTEWMQRNRDQAKPQTLKFLSAAGHNSMTYIINYANIGEQFREVTNAIHCQTLLYLWKTLAQKA